MAQAEKPSPGLTGRAPRKRDFSARRIIGFACNQAFVFFLFYMGADHPLGLGFQETRFDRFDLACMLLFMVVGFAVVRTLTAAQLQRIFSRPALYMFAAVASAGSLLTYAFPSGEAYWLVAQGALTGVPIAYLLTAWGRAFGCESTANAVPEVFLGSLVAALVCLVFSLADASDVVMLVWRLLPLASVVNMQVPESVIGHFPATVDAQSGEGRILSLKILAGTLLFGAAAGITEAYCVALEGPALPYHPVSFVLFGAFLMGSLTLLLSDAFGRGAALNKAYRLAVVLMMVGVLLVPLPALATSLLPGQAVVLAGYLGLEAVFVGLFVVMAKVTATDCALSFSIGFTSLFAGELIGVVASNALTAMAAVNAGAVGAAGEASVAGATGAAGAAGSAGAAGAVGAAGAHAAGAANILDALTVGGDPYVGIVIAGALVLVSYVFLFTERDFDELSQIVTATDTFEDICSTMSERYGLSKRESEILAYALRGRTSERIAQELVIAKSTVDTHLRRIYAKCGVHSRQELLDLAGR